MENKQFLEKHTTNTIRMADMTDTYDDEMISDVMEMPEDDLGPREAVTMRSVQILNFDLYSPVQHILTILFFLIVGFVGNGLTIHIYRKKTNQAGASYILALAIVDIVTLCTILPAYPFLKTLRDHYGSAYQLFTYAKVFCNVCLSVDSVSNDS